MPESTRRRAKLLFLDAIGVALAASSFDFGRRAVRGLATLGTGTAQVIGLPQRLALRDAVLVTMKDGRTFERREDVHRGSPERPLTESDIIAKFMDNAGRALQPGQAGRIRDAVLEVEALANAKELAGMLSPNY